MQEVSMGQSICQEFSDMVVASDKIKESSNGLIKKEIEEVKCCISMKHFDGLMDRMDSAGYYMCQLQKDKSLRRCFIWFRHKSVY